MTKTSEKKLTDCPSNLKEAIDWILRVTGKDGQTSSGGSEKLASAVKELLTSAINGSSDNALNGVDADMLKALREWLAKNQNVEGIKNLMESLASGLATFIGYQHNNANGLIGVDGIAVSNDPLERLRDAVLGFLAGFLGTLGGVPNFKVNLNTVITALNGGIGKGQQGFGTALQKAEEVLKGVNVSSIKDVWDQLKSVKDLKKNDLNGLSAAFQTYSQKVLKAVESDTSFTQHPATEAKKHIGTLNTNLQTLVTNVGQQVATSPINVGENGVGGQRTGLKTHIDTIYKSGSGTLTELRKAFPKNDAKAYALSAASYNATSNFLSQLQSGYQSHYQGATANELNSPTSSDAAKCGKILLSCIPLIFSNLQHLYWKCKHGGWSTQQLNGSGRQGTDLKHFMDLMAFSAHWLNGGKTGGNVSSVMNTSFKDLAAASATSNYDIFLKSLNNKVADYLKAPTNNPLSALFYCSKAYFQCCQMKNAQTRPPSSIREMLYFLAAMPYSTSYEGLEKHIDNVVTNEGLDVAISGSPNSNDKLSADQIQECLTASCAFSSSVLGMVQGPGASKNTSEPWLHSLFSNSQFNLSIPSSGAALFSKVSSYAYALQFQLHFLYQQCSNTYAVGCGWRHCRFGKGINNGSKTPVLSHMCNGYRCSDPSTCSHNGTNSGNSAAECKHNEGSPGEKCGQGSNKSPLQAFLTDQLRGFSRGQPSDPSSHLATCSGVLCHVPMGFTAENLRATSNGNTQGDNICLTLKAFCGGFNAPLRQLCEKLGCLTKRTPRTLGDLFGFTWHLNGQLFKSAQVIDKLKSAVTPNPTSVQEFIEKLKQSLTSPQYSPENSGLVKSLQTMAPKIPFLYQLLMTNSDDFLPVTFFNLKGTDHNIGGMSQYKGTHNDLYSLYNPNCTTSPQTCGPYLYPLTHSDGATYAPRNASAYLSWVLYLSDDLQSWFHEMLNEFRNIDCKKSGCIGKSQCNHEHGTHGVTSCTCDSVVYCGGTLPLLYRHGFRYFNPLLLMGRGNKDSYTKRDCKAFAEQLQNVITGNPLNSLITSIDTFLYAIRWEFFSKLSAFWSVYVCIILYTFFFLLDTLRVRSHLHFPSSNSIAPISLLGTRKAPALTKFTTLTYFIP